MCTASVVMATVLAAEVVGESPYVPAVCIMEVRVIWTRRVITGSVSRKIRDIGKY